MAEHKCTPRWWPHHLGEHWRCDTCGHGFHVAYAKDMGGVSAKAIRLGILQPDQLGWQSDA